MFSPDSETAEVLGGSFSDLRMATGKILSVRTPSGGGFGLAYERDPKAVLTDVENGKVTSARAAQDYGVVIVHGEIDEAATAVIRNA